MIFPYHAKAVAKYHSPHEQDLKLDVGDAVLVVDHAPGGDATWLIGETPDGRRGIFPENVTERTDAQSSADADAGHAHHDTAQEGEGSAAAVAQPTKTPHQDPLNTAPDANADAPTTTAVTAPKSETATATESPAGNTEVPAEPNTCSQKDAPDSAAAPSPKQAPVEPDISSQSEAPQSEAPQSEAPADTPGATVPESKEAASQESTAPAPPSNLPPQELAAGSAPSAGAALASMSSAKVTDPSRMSLRDRIAAFNNPAKNTAPPPIPHGKPAWKRPTPTAETPPASTLSSASKPDATRRMAAPAHGEPVLASTQSSLNADDARSSIKMSLKERMAALQRNDAAQKTPPPAPPKKLSADQVKAAQGSQNEDTEEDPEQRQAIARRMAALGGRRTAPIGVQQPDEPVPKAIVKPDKTVPDEATPAAKPETETTDAEPEQQVLSVPRRAAAPRTRRAPKAPPTEALAPNTAETLPGSTGDANAKLAPESTEGTSANTATAAAPEATNAEAPAAQNEAPSDLARDTQVPSEDTTPTTVIPETTASVAATDARDPTEAPVPAEAPTRAGAPAPAEAPAAVEAPAPSEAPAAVEAPAPSEAPVDAEAPAPAEAPALAEVPAPAEAPAPVEARAPPEVHSPAEVPAPAVAPALATETGLPSTELPASAARTEAPAPPTPASEMRAAHPEAPSTAAIPGESSAAVSGNAGPAASLARIEAPVQNVAPPGPAETQMRSVPPPSAPGPAAEPAESVEHTPVPTPFALAGPEVSLPHDGANYHSEAPFTSPISPSLPKPSRQVPKPPSAGPPESHAMHVPCVPAPHPPMPAELFDDAHGPAPAIRDDAQVQTNASVLADTSGTQDSAMTAVPAVPADVPTAAQEHVPSVPRPRRPPPSRAVPPVPDAVRAAPAESPRDTLPPIWTVPFMSTTEVPRNDDELALLSKLTTEIPSDVPRVNEVPEYEDQVRQLEELLGDKAAPETVTPSPSVTRVTRLASDTRPRMSSRPPPSPVGEAPQIAPESPNTMLPAYPQATPVIEEGAEPGFAAKSEEELEQERREAIMRRIQRIGGQRIGGLPFPTHAPPAPPAEPPAAAPVPPLAAPSDTSQTVQNEHSDQLLSPEALSAGTTPTRSPPMRSPPTLPTHMVASPTSPTEAPPTPALHSVASSGVMSPVTPIVSDQPVPDTAPLPGAALARKPTRAPPRAPGSST